MASSFCTVPRAARKASSDWTRKCVTSRVHSEVRVDRFAARLRYVELDEDLHRSSATRRVRRRLGDRQAQGGREETRGRCRRKTHCQRGTLLCYRRLCRDSVADLGLGLLTFRYIRRWGRKPTPVADRAPSRASSKVPRASSPTGHLRPATGCTCTATPLRGSGPGR